MIWLAALVAALTVVRLLVADWVPLAPDETYYWIWSRALAPGYLDHPPMVALWIKAGSALAGQTALGLRLLGPLATALASWLVYDAATRMFADRRAAAAAVLLLNGTLLLGVGSIIMTPDSPLLFFWTATLWAMIRLIRSGRGGWWLVAGIAAGLALASKYTGAFLWLGIGAWTLGVPEGRAWLRRWQPWLAVILGIMLFAPVVAWNAAHHWAGFLKQGGRVGDWQPVRALGFIGELIGGQIGLATPGIWLLCMIGLWIAARRTWASRDPAWSLLAALSIPPVLVFLQHAIGDRVQGNWPAIIYPALAIAAAGWLAERNNRAWIGASSLGFAITALAYAQALWGILPLPPRLDPIALRLSGWPQMTSATDNMRIASAAGFIAVEGYAAASELAWWSAPSVPVLGIDPRWTLFDLPTVSVAGKSGLLIRDARRTEPPDPALWAAAEQIGSLNRTEGQAGFAVFHVIGATPAAPTGLPRRP